MPISARTAAAPATRNSARRSSSAARLALALLLAAAAPAVAAGSAARGAYLAAAAGCDQCHTAPGGKPYAGGRELSTDWGRVTTPNITPDRAAGIGGWHFADFVRAMRWGIAPDDSHYLPAFPFPFYGRLSDADLADLKAFLDTVPPAADRDRPVGGSFFAPVRAAIAVVAEPFDGKWRADSHHDAAWNRGAYLVATVGRCGDCHTPRDMFGAPDPARFLAGRRLNDGKKVPNITSDPQAGIGKWQASQIVDLLDTGETPDGDFVGGPMGEIVRNTSRLNADDRRAIAAYLKSIPAAR